MVKGDDTGRKMMNMVLRNVEDSLNMMKNQAGTIEEDLSELDVNEAKNELVINHPESLLNGNMTDLDSRNSKNEIEIDFKFKYLNEIVKYMNNEYDINQLNGIEFDEFCRELMEMRIPFKMDIMNRICTGFNVYGVGWKNRCVIMNGNEYELLMNYIKYGS